MRGGFLVACAGSWLVTRFWKRIPDSPIESLLTGNRPLPRDEFVAAVVERVESGRQPRVRTFGRRLVLAAVVTVLAVGAAAAAGGGKSASDGVGSLVDVAKKTVVPPKANSAPHGNRHGSNGGNRGRGAADVQYTVTICHATGSKTNPYVELTLSPEGAAAHLANHPGDFVLVPPATSCPAAPTIDLAITKTGTPNPATVGNQVTWTMVVTNNIGLSDATGVTVADALPAGTKFISASSTQGTCAGVHGTLVICQIGDMASGATVTITLNTTAKARGSITNTATVVGDEAETDPANSTATASVVVSGPFKPPVVYCTAVVVSPKSLSVGRRHVLTMRVSQHGKPTSGVRVHIKGPTLNILTEPSNSRGLVTRSVKPMRAGIVTFIPVAQKSCKNPRIGVIGAFTPPVTG